MLVECDLGLSCEKIHSSALFSHTIATASHHLTSGPQLMDGFKIDPWQGVGGEKSFHLYWAGNMPFNSLFEVFVNHIGGWLLYSIPPALVCAILGLILWSGRKNTFWGKTLQILPPIFILIETIILFYSVFVYRTNLFSASSNLVCLMAYMIIYFSALRKSTTMP